MAATTLVTGTPNVVPHDREIADLVAAARCGDEVAFGEWRSRNFDARGTATGDQKENVVVSIHEVEEPAARRETVRGVIGMSPDRDVESRAWRRHSITGRDRGESVPEFVNGRNSVEQCAGALADGHDVAGHVVPYDSPDEPLGRAAGQRLEVDRLEVHLRGL